MGRRQFCSISFLTIAILSIGLSACSSDDDSVSAWTGLTPTAFGMTKEFVYNYNSLYYLYIDKDKYLDSPESYIGKVNTQFLVDEGYPWDFHDIYYMYALMNDPFTNYMDPTRALTYISSWMSSEELMGAGFELDSLKMPDKYIIGQIDRNSPADKAGLKVGDEITEIEGVALTNETVFKRLTVAERGDTITYTIKRDTTTLTIPVVIDSYRSPTVDISFKDSIPVIKISEFTAYTSNDSGTYGEFVEYLRETEKYKTTIIDLRYNGGGELDQCIAMAQTLLSKGDTTIGIISAYADTIHKRQAFDTTFYINKTDGFAKDRYFVFLANGRTASCSEVMIAGTVANKKYPVIGTVTYGKGIGQTRSVTPSYSIASITNMKVIDKQRISYHKYGIMPDFTLSDDDEALEKAVALAKDQSYVRVAGYGTVNTGNFAKMAVEPDSMPGFYLLPNEYRKKF